MSLPESWSDEDFQQRCFKLESTLFNPEEWWEYAIEDRVKVDYHAVRYGVVMKVQAVIYSSAKDVFESLWNMEQRQKWDEYIRDGRTVRPGFRKDPASNGQVISFVALIPCGYRDFCIEQHYAKRKNAEGREEYIACWHSVVHPDVPVDPSNTRAELLNSGFIVRPICTELDPKGEDTSVVFMLLDVVLGGWLTDAVGRTYINELAMSLNCMPQYLPDDEPKDEDKDFLDTLGEVIAGTQERGEKIDELAKRSADMRLESDQLRSNAARLKEKQKRSSTCTLL